MKGLLIVGAGGHGKVVAEIAQACGQWDQIAFLDARYQTLNGQRTWPVLSDVDQAQMLQEDYPDVVLAVGDAERRLSLMSLLQQQGFNLPVLVHPSACISPSASLGTGTVVMPMAVVNADAKVGRACIINTGATVDHDSVLADGVHVCPGANLAGEVRVGRASWLGIGCSVIQQVNIGESVMVAARAAVTKDVENHVVVAGVPAKVIKKNG